jgi:hypothetical protein
VPEEAHTPVNKKKQLIKLSALPGPPTEFAA